MVWACRGWSSTTWGRGAGWWPATTTTTSWTCTRDPPSTPWTGRTQVRSVNILNKKGFQVCLTIYFCLNSLHQPCKIDNFTLKKVQFFLISSKKKPGNVKLFRQKSKTTSKSETYLRCPWLPLPIIIQSLTRFLVIIMQMMKAAAFVKSWLRWQLFDSCLVWVWSHQVCKNFVWNSLGYLVSRTLHLVWWDFLMIWYLTYAATCEWFIEVIFASKLGFMPSTKLTFTTKTGKITQEDSVINFNHAVTAFTPAIIYNFVGKLQNKFY